MEQVDWEMPTNAYHWTETHQKLVNNFMRYKTTAERAYQKSFRIVESYFRDCLRDEIAAGRAELMRLKIEAQTARKSPKSKPVPQESEDATLQTATPLVLSRRNRAIDRDKSFKMVESLPLDPSTPPVTPDA
jgi:hypothetical protein